MRWWELCTGKSEGQLCGARYVLRETGFLDTTDVIDALHDAFRLTLGDDSNEIRGEATVTLRLAVDGVRVVFLETTTRQAMEVCDERIGPYSYEHISKVQVAGISGDTEHATTIFCDEKDVVSGSGDVVHDVAHRRWLNAVTQSDRGQPTLLDPSDAEAYRKRWQPGAGCPEHHS